MLESIKKSLRISSDAFDDEITDLISACERDMKVSGVVIYDVDDALIKRANILYSKANFGMSNPDSDKYDKVYQSLKMHLALSNDYNTEVIEDDV